jgi:hypothetical protein
VIRTRYLHRRDNVARHRRTGVPAVVRRRNIQLQCPDFAYPPFDRPIDEPADRAWCGAQRILGMGSVSVYGLGRQRSSHHGDAQGELRKGGSFASEIILEKSAGTDVPAAQGPDQSGAGADKVFKISIAPGETIREPSAPNPARRPVSSQLEDSAVASRRGAIPSGCRQVHIIPPKRDFR